MTTSIPVLPQHPAAAIATVVALSPKTVQDLKQEPFHIQHLYTGLDGHLPKVAISLISTFIPKQAECRKLVSAYFDAFANGAVPATDDLREHLAMTQILACTSDSFLAHQSDIDARVATTWTKAFAEAVSTSEFRAVEITANSVSRTANRCICDFLAHLPQSRMDQLVAVTLPSSAIADRLSPASLQRSMQALSLQPRLHPQLLQDALFSRSPLLQSITIQCQIFSEGHIRPSQLPPLPFPNLHKIRQITLVGCAATDAEVQQWCGNSFQLTKSSPRPAAEKPELEIYDYTLHRQNVVL